MSAPINGKPINVTEAAFDKAVLQSDKPVLVDFWAEWCGPCRMIAPALEDLADDYDGKVTIAKVNIDQNPAVAQVYGVRSIPTLALFKDGRVAATVLGAQPKAKLAEFIDSHVA